MSQPTNYILIVLQMVLAIATIATALFTAWQARINQKALLLRLQPLIRADWKLLNQGQFRAALAVTISETAGVPTELRRADTHVRFAQNGDEERSLDLRGTVLHGKEATCTVPVYIDLNRAGTRGFGHFATADVALTVSAFGIDDPRIWKVEAYLSDSGNGAITVSPMPGATHVLRIRKPSLRQRFAKLGKEWDAFNKKCRRLEY